jgi:hypothetical protein
VNNFIAAAIVLPILLFFVPQFALQIENTHNTEALSVIVESAKEKARQEGYFTTEILNEMRADIATEFKRISPSEIIVNATTTPKYRTDGFDRRELIEYSVGVPLKKLLAANRLFGISDEKNKAMVFLKGSIASERLP